MINQLTKHSTGLAALARRMRRYAVKPMIKVTTGNEEFELKAYCQYWLELIAAGDFDAAGKLVDAPNCYGLSWGKQEIMAVIEDHFGESIEFNILKYV